MYDLRLCRMSENNRMFKPDVHPASQNRCVLTAAPKFTISAWLQQLLQTNIDHDAATAVLDKYTYWGRA